MYWEASRRKQMIPEIMVRFLKLIIEWIKKRLAQL